MEGKYAVKLSTTELIKLVGNERNVIMVAYGKCKCGLTPDSSRSQLHEAIFIYSPLELRDSQLFDGDLQPVIHWMEGKAPTQNKVKLHGKTTRILCNWMDRFRMQNVVLNATTLNTQACVLHDALTTRSRRAHDALTTRSRRAHDALTTRSRRAHDALTTRSRRAHDALTTRSRRASLARRERVFAVCIFPKTVSRRRERVVSES